MFGVGVGNRLCHPIQRVLGVDGAIARMAGFLAFVRQRIFDFAQVRAERHGDARFLADLTHRGMPVRFVLFQFALRPAPVVVFRTVHHAHLHAVELFLRCFPPCDGGIRRDFGAVFPTPYNAAGRFDDLPDFFTHMSFSPSPSSYASCFRHVATPGFDVRPCARKMADSVECGIGHCLYISDSPVGACACESGIPDNRPADDRLHPSRGARTCRRIPYARRRWNRPSADRRT